jgi:hypothetical protein
MDIYFEFIRVYIGAPTSVRRGTTVDTGDVWECQMNLQENPNPSKTSRGRDSTSIVCTPWNGLNKASPQRMYLNTCINTS